MTLSPDDYIRAVNPSDETVDVAGVKFGPGAYKMMPFAWMVNHYGDPRSVLGKFQVWQTREGQQGVVQPREMERMKINTMWNISPGGRAWEDVPYVEFYTVEDERIYTVYDDPFGEKVTPMTQTVDEAKQLKETVLRQQRQIDQLLAVSGLDRDALPAEPAAPPDIPTDESTATSTTSPWAHSQDGVDALYVDED